MNLLTIIIVKSVYEVHYSVVILPIIFLFSIPFLDFSTHLADFAHKS
jgi:hypothetical protein